MTDAIKHDTGKLRWDLVPYDALEEVVRIYTNGAEKYGERNWEKGLSSSRLMSATMRHLIAWWMGADRDKDQPEHYNLAAAAWNILALMAYHLRGTGTDDRPTCKQSLPVESLTMHFGPARLDSHTGFTKPTDKYSLSVAEDSSVTADEDIPHPCSELGMTQFRLRLATQQRDRLAIENKQLRAEITNGKAGDE